MNCNRKRDEVWCWRMIAGLLLLCCLLLRFLPGCAELPALLGVAAPIARDVALGEINRSRVSAGLPALQAEDPRVTDLDRRVKALEAAEAAEKEAETKRKEAALDDALEAAAKAKEETARQRRAYAYAIRRLKLASASPGAGVDAGTDAGAP